MSLCRVYLEIVEPRRSIRMQGCQKLNSYVPIAVSWFRTVAVTERCFPKTNHTYHSPRIALMVCRIECSSAEFTKHGPAGAGRI